MTRKHIVLSPLMFIVTVFALLLMVSCGPERKLAKQFMKGEKPVAILLLAPDYVFKTSYKLPDSLDLGQISPLLHDSVLMANTRLIKAVNDSMYLGEFIRGIRNELNMLGFQVYDSESAVEFLAMEKKALIVNLAQAGLEEFYDSVAESARFDDDDVYNYDFFITSVNMNFWFELSGLNHYDSVMRVLFSQQTIADWVEGDFRYFQFTGDVKYIYDVDSLQVSDIYYFAGKTGQLNASYLYDYLLNKYIQNHMVAGQLPQKAFTYDRYSGLLKRLKIWGFTEIEE